MRKLILLIFLFSGAVMYYACKKDKAAPGADPGIINKIATWLEGQKSETQKNKNLNISQLQEHLDFAAAAYESCTDKEDLLVVPVKEAFKKIKNLDGRSLLNLVVKVGKSGNISKGYVAVFIPKDYTLKEVPGGTFSKIFNYKETGLDGQFRFLTVSGNRIFQLEFKSGKLHAFGHAGKKTSNGPQANLERDAMICTDWYWVTTYYVDGVAVDETWDYIGQTCNGNSSTECDQSYDNLCLSGGGDGGASSEDQCCITDPNYQFSSNPVSIANSDDCGLEGIDQISGLPIKTCTHTWTFAKNSLLWYYWDYKSTETANLLKTGGLWKFKTVSHTGKSLVGTTPACVDVSWDISSATASISSDQMQAQMSLQYWTTCKVTCIPYSPPKTLNGASYTTWNAPQ